MRAPADGYTITMANLSMLAINPFLYTKLPYDVVRDFAGAADPACAGESQIFIEPVATSIAHAQAECAHWL